MEGEVFDDIRQFIEGAKKEETFTLYDSHTWFRTIAKEFEKKYPFIKVSEFRTDGRNLIKRAIESRTPVWLATVGNWLFGRWMTESVLKEIVHDPGLLTSAVIERANRNRQRPGLVPAAMSLARNLPLWEEGFARQLGQIRHPTLVLWGTEDRIFPPQVGKELHATVQGSTFMLIAGAGHIPQWERPEAVNPILLKFLQP